YTVFDLGKQVPVNTIIDKAVEVGADAIGLSALLVSTSKQMPICVQELDRREAFVTGNLDDARRDVFLRSGVGKDIAAGTNATTRSEVATDNAVPEAPFFGTRVLHDIPLDEVLALLDLDELFRLQWGGRGSGEAFDATVRDEFRPTLERLSASARS